jgi:hypothetical protein
MRRLLLAMTLVAAPATFAQVVAATPEGVVVAHDGRIALDGRWTADGVEQPSSIAVSPERIAVLDALANELVVADLATGSATRHQTDETPIAAEFLGRDLYVLARDARVLRRIGGPAVALSADPAFLRQSSGKLYVYSRTSGAIEEIERDRVTRRLAVPPFASDFEISGTTGYLVYPRDARVRMIDLAGMKAEGELAVGAVPVDLQFAGGGTALTARLLAVADPSAKRVWLAEAETSMTKAVARGFLRGLLGLGLFGSRASQFPTGVDRVEIAGKNWAAYDSSSGTLYRFDRRKSSVVAKDVGPRAFAVTPDGIVWWRSGRLHRSR